MARKIRSKFLRLAGALLCGAAVFCSCTEQHFAAMDSGEHTNAKKAGTILSGLGGPAISVYARNKESAQEQQGAFREGDTVLVESMSPPHNEKYKRVQGEKKERYMHWDSGWGEAVRIESVKTPHKETKEQCKSVLEECNDEVKILQEEKKLYTKNGENNLRLLAEATKNKAELRKTNIALETRIKDCTQTLEEKDRDCTQALEERDKHCNQALEERDRHCNQALAKKDESNTFLKNQCEKNHNKLMSDLNKFKSDLTQTKLDFQSCNESLIEYENNCFTSSKRDFTDFSPWGGPTINGNKLELGLHTTYTAGLGVLGLVTTAAIANKLLWRNNQKHQERKMLEHWKERINQKIVKGLTTINSIESDLSVIKENINQSSPRSQQDHSGRTITTESSDRSEIRGVRTITTESSDRSRIREKILSIQKEIGNITSVVDTIRTDLKNITEEKLIEERLTEEYLLELEKIVSNRLGTLKKKSGITSYIRKNESEGFRTKTPRGRSTSTTGGNIMLDDNTTLSSIGN